MCHKANTYSERTPVAKEKDVGYFPVLESDKDFKKRTTLPKATILLFVIGSNQWIRAKGMNGSSLKWLTGCIVQQWLTTNKRSKNSVVLQSMKLDVLAGFQDMLIHQRLYCQ